MIGVPEALMWQELKILSLFAPTAATFLSNFKCELLFLGADIFFQFWVLEITVEVQVFLFSSSEYYRTYGKK